MFPRLANSPRGGRGGRRGWGREGLSSGEAGCHRDSSVVRGIETVAVGNEVKPKPRRLAGLRRGEVASPPGTADGLPEPW